MEGHPTPHAPLPREGRGRSDTLGRVRGAAYWDEQAARFDVEPDHGLRNPVVRSAWRGVLAPLVPASSLVLDVGCGTGSLAVLLAGEGHDVTGLDLSPRMIERARAKAATAGVEVAFRIGDAATPPSDGGPYDVVLCRHVLWALPDADGALQRWSALLAPAGRLLLVEGRWASGGGLSADELRGLVLRHRAEAGVVPLTDPDLWGRRIDDERFLVISRR